VGGRQKPIKKAPSLLHQKRNGGVSRRKEGYQRRLKLSAKTSQKKPGAPGPKDLEGTDIQVRKTGTEKEKSRRPKTKRA